MWTKLIINNKAKTPTDTKKLASGNVFIADGILTAQKSPNREAKQLESHGTRLQLAKTRH